VNIFASDPDPAVSARFLDDKRVIKMVLESAQLLSTAMNECGAVGPYRTTHKNHPCSIWCRQSRTNYEWLLNHLRELCAEYARRYGKTHKCEGLIDTLTAGALAMPDIEATPIPNCTIYKQEPDVYKAYREYLKYKWTNDKRKPTWFKVSRTIDL